MLGSVESTGHGQSVVADFEAGIGTLTRLQPGQVDALLVVVEPTAKSMEVGVRAADLARDRKVGRVVVVANRIRTDDDLATIRQAFGGYEVVGVPDDDVIVRADREGVAPLDLDPEAPAVAALVALATLLADDAAGARSP